MSFTGLILVEREKSLVRGLVDDTRDAVMAYSGPLDTYEADELTPVEKPWDIAVTEDQARMNSCGGHGLSTAGERCAGQRGVLMALSRMWSYLRGKARDNIRGDRGMTIGGGVWVAKNLGICRESVFPYPQSYSEFIPPNAAEDAKNFLIGSASDITAGGQEMAQQFLGRNMGALYCGCAWTNNMANPRNGVIESFGFGDGQGGHAWAIVALSPRKQGNLHYYWLANSHSIRYGNRGFAEVSPDTFEGMLRHRFTEAVGLSEPTVPVANPRFVLPKWGLVPPTQELPPCVPFSS